jgi:hypothetical protein
MMQDKTIGIHVVSGVFPVGSFDRFSNTYNSDPTHYRCSVCTFSGTLEQGIEHTVTHQFKVTEELKLGEQ